MEDPSKGFKQIIREIQQEGSTEVDCKEVDVEELEQAGMALLSNIQDIALNVDLDDV